jgi:hypothetical protein
VKLLALAVLAACGANTDKALDAPGGDGPTASDGGIDASTAIPDPCPATAPACPVASNPARGSGLQPIDRCAFPLTDTGTWTDRTALIDALPASIERVAWSDVVTDLNRAGTTIGANAVPGGPAGVKSAFQWQSGDQSVTYWIPQGITGSFDGSDDGLAAARKLLLVSWYYEMANDPGSTADKGVRIAIVDVTNPAAIAYRFALLVDPIAGAGGTEFAAIHVHAGGLAWVGNYLYVPVTGSGFRVFDLTRILKMPGTADTLDTSNAYGYKYAIPQVGEYKDAGACDAVFSFVALDRSSTPPSLISGEYDSASVNGRLYRWPLDTTGRLVMTDRARVIPDATYVMAESHVQGGVAHADTFYLSSSQPAGSGGALYTVKVATPSTTRTWIDSPEDLAYDPQTNRLWCLAEAADARAVMSASAQ